MLTRRIASFHGRAAGHLALVCAALAILAITGPSAQASSVAPMTLEAMSNHAGQVITGTVVSIQSYWADAPRRIESEITLEQVEYLKGSLADSSGTFTVVVPGGAVGQTTMRLSCAPIFEVGERWLLFVLPTYKTFPVVGIWNGAMRIEQTATGENQILTATGRSVIGIDGEGFIRTPGGADSRTASSANLLVGSSKARLIPELGRAGAEQALLLNEFLAQLQPILDNSKDYQLTEQAGRRELVQHTPVPLIRSALDQPTVRTKRSHGVSRLARPAVNPAMQYEVGRTTEVGQ